MAARRQERANGAELVAQSKSNDVKSRLRDGDEVVLRIKGTSDVVTATVTRELSCLVGGALLRAPEYQPGRPARREGLA